MQRARTAQLLENAVDHGARLIVGGPCEQRPARTTLQPCAQPSAVIARVALLASLGRQTPHKTSLGWRSPAAVAAAALRSSSSGVTGGPPERNKSGWASVARVSTHKPTAVNTHTRLRSLPRVGPRSPQTPSPSPRRPAWQRAHQGQPCVHKSAAFGPTGYGGSVRQSRVAGSDALEHLHHILRHGQSHGLRSGARGEGTRAHTHLRVARKAQRPVPRRVGSRRIINHVYAPRTRHNLAAAARPLISSPPRRRRTRNCLGSYAFLESVVRAEVKALRAERPALHARVPQTRLECTSSACDGGMHIQCARWGNAYPVRAMGECISSACDGGMHIQCARWGNAYRVRAMGECISSARDGGMHIHTPSGAPAAPRRT